MPVLAILCGLLATIGILAAPSAPAGPQPAPPSAMNSIAAAEAVAAPDTTVPRTASAGPGAGGEAHRDAASPGSAGGRGAVPSRPDDLPRSLVYSGLLGLAISLTGLTLVMRRRRSW